MKSKGTSKEKQLKSGKDDSIRELAKEYGVNPQKALPDLSVPQYLRKVGRNDLSRVYEFVRKDLKADAA